MFFLLGPGVAAVFPFALFGEGGIELFVKVEVLLLLRSAFIGRRFAGWRGLLLRAGVAIVAVAQAATLEIARVVFLRVILMVVVVLVVVIVIVVEATWAAWGRGTICRPRRVAPRHQCSPHVTDKKGSFGRLPP